MPLLIDLANRLAGIVRPLLAAKVDAATVWTKTESDARYTTAARIAELVGTAPERLDQLGELSAAIGDNPNFSADVLSGLSGKVSAADLGTVDDFAAALTAALAAPATPAAG